MRPSHKSSARPHRARLLLALQLGVGACAQEDFVGETSVHVEPDLGAPLAIGRHVEVYSLDEEEICEPLGARLDDEVERLADALGGVSISVPVRMLWGEAGLYEVCGLDPAGPPPRGAGCTPIGRGDFVVASAGAEVHELAHALANRAGIGGPPVLREGLASYLAGKRPYSDWRAFRSSSLDVSDAMRSGETIELDDYPLATHFVAYVDTTFGRPALLDLAASWPDVDVDEAFDVVLQQSLDEVETAWSVEAPPAYLVEIDCDQYLDVVSDAPTPVTGAVGCDDPASVGPMPGSDSMFRGTRYCVDTQPSDTLEVSLIDSGSAGTVEIRPRPDRACPLDEPSIGGFISQGETGSFDARGCQWSIIYGSDDTPTPYEISVRVVAAR
jgi:hypothetical protein